MSIKFKKKLNLQHQISEDSFRLPIRVYYQDTDAGGVVYHSTHLDFMERARYEWLRELGFDVHTLTQVHKVLFMVRSLEIEYFKPAVLDDLLHVTVQVAEMGRSSIALLQQTFCNDTMLVSATIRVVCVGTESLRAVRAPIPLRDKIEKLS